MQKREMTFRCLAKKQSDDLWVAMCIDLSLAAQGDTQEEAKRKLSEQLKEYILEALEEPEYTEQLLNRKAPLSLHLEYHFAPILSAAQRLKRTLVHVRSEASDFTTFDCPMSVEKIPSAA